MMSDHSPKHDGPVPPTQPLRLESASGDFVLIPQNVEPQTEKDTNESIDLGMLLAILRRQWPLALRVILATVGLGAALTLYQRIFSPIYEGGFSLLIGDPVNSAAESQSSDSGSNLKSLALQSSRVPTIQVSQDLIDVLKSPFLLKPISKRLGIKEDKLASSLTIERRSGDTSSVLDVSLKWKDPEQGKKILDNLKNDYLNFSTNQRREKLAQSVSYLNEQAPALQKKLSVVQGQLSDFRIRNRLLDPSTEGDAIIKQLEDLKGRQDQLLRKEAELQALASAVRAGNLSSQQIPGAGQQVSTATKAIGAVDARSGTGLDQLQQDLAQLQKELAITEATFQSASPLVQSLKARISRVQTLLQQRQLNAIDVTLKQIHGEQVEIERQQTELQKQFTLNPILIKQNDAIQQRLEVAKANLASYIKAREDIRLLVAQRTIPWTVISPPIFENKLSKPNIPINLLLSLSLGMGAGVGAALLRNKLENMFHTSLEVAEAIGLPLLGTMLFLPSITDHKAEVSTAINQTKESSRLRRALQIMYTNIRLSPIGKNIRLIAITSTLQGEGKSTLTYLYAKELSDLGKRVLVVDADLRQPTLHRFFGVENIKGFFNLLSDVSSAPEQFIQSPRETLHLLTAGPSPNDPLNLLSSERCTRVIEQIRTLEGYDYVLFDISSALELSDSLLIGEKLDAILFLVSLGLVHRDLPPKALKRIQSTGTKVLGVVSNEPKPSPIPALTMLMDAKRQISALDWRGSSPPRRSVTPESTST